MKNMLTPAQLERLAKLSEELGEAQQIIGKIMLHGYDSFMPSDKEMKINKLLLEMELGDILAAIHLLKSNFDINIENIKAYSQIKIDKFSNRKAYMHYTHIVDPYEK